jgi:hypothetical protein
VRICLREVIGEQRVMAQQRGRIVMVLVRLCRWSAREVVGGRVHVTVARLGLEIGDKMNK